MTVKEALSNSYQKLKKHQITSANLDADVLLMSVLKKSKEWLYANPEKKLTQSQITRFKKLINKRCQYWPVAYLTGQKEFYGLNFKVNKHVLVPRPETELLVECALKVARKINKQEIVIADIGTGSGCIAISLIKNLKNLNILAVDKSASALKIAKENTHYHRVGSKIKFFHGDLLAPIKNYKVDIVVANLPYLDTQMDNLFKSSESGSLKYEPQMALWSGANGLNAYRTFFKQIKEFKIYWKYILIEVGYKQTAEIKKIIYKNFKPKNIKIIKDITGINRVVIIENL